MFEGLKGLTSLWSQDMAIDLGTANTLVVAGQLIYDDGVLIGAVASIDGTDKIITTANPIPIVTRIVPLSGLQIVLRCSQYLVFAPC